MNKLKSLVMRMAENKVEANNIKHGIYETTNDLESGYVNIDLNKYREHWYGFNYAWEGWVKAVEHYEGVAGENASIMEKKMAELLDRRSRNKKDLGNIRRALCAAGRKLLRDEQKL